jgi:hypothetical protein
MAGIALYAVDGGNLRKVTISDVTMDGVTVPISIRLGARLKTFRPGTDPRSAPGTLSDVTINNVSATNVRMVGMLINGVAGHPVERLNLENVRIELPGGGTPEMANISLSEKEAAYPEYSMFGKNIPAYGLYVRHARDIRLQNVQMILQQPDARPAQILIDAERIVPAGGVPDMRRAGATVPSSVIADEVAAPRLHHQ